MGTTPRGIPFPEPTAFVVDGPAAIQALAVEVDAELDGVAAAAAAAQSSAVPKALVDAAGDLLVGSAADTVARLPKGTTGQVLSVVAGSVAWGDPPASAAPLAKANISVSGSTTSNAQTLVAPAFQVTFTPTSSGTVIVALTGRATAVNSTSWGNQVMWQLFDVTANAAVGSELLVVIGGNGPGTVDLSVRFRMTGLAPGVSRTVQLRHRTTDTRGAAVTGGGGADFLMQVEAA